MQFWGMIALICIRRINNCNRLCLMQLLPSNARFIPNYIWIHVISYRVKYWNLDTMHIWTLYLEVGSSDKGWGYAKRYLGVTLLHISSESPWRNFSMLHQDAKKMGFGNSYVWMAYSFSSSACQNRPAWSVLFLIVPPRANCTLLTKHYLRFTGAGQIEIV